MTTLKVDRGDTIELVVGPVVDASGAVQDLTGATFRFTAKDRKDDDDAAAIITASTGDGRITVPDPATGMAYVTIPAPTTAAFAADRTLYWDVQVSQPGGRVKTLDSGLLYVTRDVTRAV